VRGGAQLTNGSLDAPFLIEVFDWNKDDEPDLIGTATVCIFECLP